MAKRKVLLKTSYLIITLPYLFFAQLFYYFNFWNFRNDVKACSHIIESYSEVEISENLIQILVIAEDHRNSYHFGIDQFALLRAIISIIKGNIQGASTIEQQFVRVATNRYQRTIKRKFIEQLLAVYITNIYEKKVLAKTYLCIAYYGEDKLGFSWIKILFKPIDNLSLLDSIQIISRLKYPEPKKQTNKWILRHHARNNYLLDKLSCNYRVMK